MTRINPAGNEPIKRDPVLYDLLKTIKPSSIFMLFDTNQSGSISDSEITEKGFQGEAFEKVKAFLSELFPGAVHNFKDEDGFFEYYDDSRPTIPAESLEDLPTGSHPNIKDARGYDISNLNLTEEQLLNLCIDKTTILSDEQKAMLEPYIEKMKDPGLGVRGLHERGITGQGVKMAIIDQPLGRHNEYADNIVEMHDINAEEMGWRASMHGAAVSSIAVGKNVGVAPDADLVYYSAVNMTKAPDEVKAYIERIEQEIELLRGMGPEHEHYISNLQEQIDMSERYNECPSNLPYVEAINKILDDNEKLPKEERVAVISISWGFDSFAPGYEELQQAIQRAKDQGVFIVSTALEEHYGMSTCGANRDPKGDVDDPNNYEAGAFWKDYERGIVRDNSKLLLVPMDHRTVADFTDPESFRYEGNDGGMSWSTPWLAGIYVLARQVDPDITPEKFWQLALETSDECNNNDDGRTVGRILNSQRLIEKVEELKGKDLEQEEHHGTIINQDSLLNYNKEMGRYERQRINSEQRDEILRRNTLDLYNTYGNNYDIYVNVNDYGDADWSVRLRSSDS